MVRILRVGSNHSVFFFSCGNPPVNNGRRVFLTWSVGGKKHIPRTTLGRFWVDFLSRLHGPEDEKYSLKGALTRVEVSRGVGRNLLG